MHSLEWFRPLQRSISGDAEPSKIEPGPVPAVGETGESCFDFFNELAITANGGSGHPLKPCLFCDKFIKKNEVP